MAVTQLQVTALPGRVRTFTAKPPASPVTDVGAGFFVLLDAASGIFELTELVTGLFELVPVET